MLGRQNDLGHTDGHAVFIAHGKLRFGIWAKGRLGARFADFGQTAQHRVGELDRRGHQRVGFIRGIAEHDALIACALVLVGAGVHALCDMGGLLVQQVGDFAGGVVEFFLLIADVLDAGAGDVGDAFHIFGQLGLVRQTDLTADDDAVGRGESLAGDARLGFFGEEGVQNRVGNAVADLVRVPFRDGLGGENVILS